MNLQPIISYLEQERAKLDWVIQMLTSLQASGRVLPDFGAFPDDVLASLDANEAKPEPIVAQPAPIAPVAVENASDYSDLTLREETMLRHLKLGPNTIKSCAEVSRCSKMTASNTLRSLEARGYVRHSGVKRGLLFTATTGPRLETRDGYLVNSNATA